MHSKVVLDDRWYEVGLEKARPIATEIGEEQDIITYVWFANNTDSLENERLKLQRELKKKTEEDQQNGLLIPKCCRNSDKLAALKFGEIPENFG